MLAVLGLAWLSFLCQEGEWPAIPADFSAYWGGAKLALAGEAGRAYSGAGFDDFLGELHEAQPRGGLRFPYPPSMFLLLWPLGLLPFAAAWAAFLIPGMAAFFLIARRLTDPVTAAGMTFAIGGPIHSIQMGQNGFYVAALLIGGLLMLQRSKPVAGIAIGVLAIKPHLAVVAIFALLAWREWKALGWAIATVLALSLLSAIVFGPNIWVDFLRGSFAFAGEVVSSKDTLVMGMHQTFIALLLRNLDPNLALIVHAAIAVIALVLCFQVKGRELSIVAVAATTFIVTPYAYLYDTAVLVLACALVISVDRRLSLVLAIVISVTGLWFFTLINVVTFVALAMLLLAWFKSKSGQRREPEFVQTAEAK